MTDQLFDRLKGDLRDGHCKVGFTRNLYQRAGELRSGAATELNIHMAMESATRPTPRLVARDARDVVPQRLAALRAARQAR